MKQMEVRKGANWWYVVEIVEDGIRAIAGFKTKKAAMEAMEGYKERMN